LIGADFEAEVGNHDLGGESGIVGDEAPVNLERAPALPVTEALAAEVLSLPMSPGISESQLAAAAVAIEDYFRGWQAPPTRRLEVRSSPETLPQTTSAP